MIKKALVVSSLIMLGFAPVNTTEYNEGESVISTKVAKDIAALTEIVEFKLQKAAMLEEQATIALAENPDSADGINLKREAKLERMMTLKYQAAIATRLR